MATGYLARFTTDDIPLQRCPATCGMLEKYLKDLRFHDGGDVAGADIAGESARKESSHSTRDELGPEHQPRGHFSR